MSGSKLSAVAPPSATCPCGTVSKKTMQWCGLWFVIVVVVDAWFVVGVVVLLWLFAYIVFFNSSL